MLLLTIVYFKILIQYLSFTIFLFLCIYIRISCVLGQIFAVKVIQYQSRQISAPIKAHRSNLSCFQRKNKEIRWNTSRPQLGEFLNNFNYLRLISNPIDMHPNINYYAILSFSSITILIQIYGIIGQGRLEPTICMDNQCLKLIIYTDT